MIYQKKWVPISAQTFILNGTQYGVLNVAEATLFKAQQRVFLKSNTLPDGLEVEVKRVTSRSTIEVGRIGQGIEDRIDVSMFTVADGATVFALLQNRPTLSEYDVIRAVFAEEPIVALRSSLVDDIGDQFNRANPLPSLTSFLRNGAAQQVSEDTVTPANNRPLPVKLTGVQGDVIIEADNLNLLVQSEGEYDAVDNPRPDSVGTVYHERGLTQDRTKQTRRTTAIRGSEDTDTVSQDVSLHDEAGNAYTEVNPLPVIGSYEKFFALIAPSKWMELATYDEVVPSIVGPDLTLTYYEDGGILGTAVITNFASPTTWSVKLNRYLADDDGTALLDDDDTILNLD